MPIRGGERFPLVIHIFLFLIVYFDFSIILIHEGFTAISEMADNNGISFEEFWKLCKRLANEPSYNMKTEIIKQFVEQKTFKG